MQLEEGKYYLTRAGGLAGPMVKNDDDQWRYPGSVTWWHDDGRWVSLGKNEKDLVRQLSDAEVAVLKLEGMGRTEAGPLADQIHSELNLKKGNDMSQTPMFISTLIFAAYITTMIASALVVGNTKDPKVEWWMGLTVLLAFCMVVLFIRILKRKQ